MNRKFNLLSISELTSDTDGIISFIRGSNELLDEISDMDIKVGQHLHFEFNEKRISGNYLVTIDDRELEITLEMANNIFIRI
jgi:DtxR family Mn-dependent transcriptional regulator